MTHAEQEQLFRELYEKSAARIMRFSRVSAWNEQTGDLFQEIWARIWEALPRFRGDCAPDTWATRVAVNTALLFRRGQGRRRKYETVVSGNGDTPQPEPDPLLSEDLRRRLHDCVAQLQPRDRMVVSLHLEGLPHKEVSSVLGLSTSHVGVVLHRLKPVLKNCITGEPS